MPGVNKFSIPLSEQFCMTVPKLKMIYALETHHQENIIMTPLVGMDKLEVLQNNLYRKQYLTDQKSVYTALKQCMRLGSQIDIVRITRPIQGFKLDELVDAIESDFIQRSFMTKRTTSQLKEISIEPIQTPPFMLKERKSPVISIPLLG